MRTLTYHVACSVDGFIAQTDGSHGGFSQESEYFSELFASFPEIVPSHLRDLMNIHAENKWVDTVLMGRKTYEVGLSDGVTSPYSHLQQYVFSRGMKQSPDPNVELISAHAIEFVKRLKCESGKGIWLCGGANLATELFTHNLIDHLILKVNPFLMGAGIPLFSGVIQQTALELTDRKIFDNGVVLLDYKVN